MRELASILANTNYYKLFAHLNIIILNTSIDILSRLIIATITFVAPMIIFCFGVFFDALKLNRKEKEEKENALANEAMLKMSETGMDNARIIKETAKKIQEPFCKKVKDFFMTPSIQIILIFGFLFISLGALMFSHLVKDNVWKMYSLRLWKFLIHFSLWTYVFSVLIIITFVTNVISMKAKVENKQK